MSQWYRNSWNTPPMTRAQLYAMVWEKPMVHVAKRFGISDVALRKICQKHDIPTPPLGYWAKLAHGKRVKQPLLPALKKDVQDAIYLEEKPLENVPAEVSSARAAVTQHENAPEARIVVPADCPNVLHSIASQTRKALNKAKANDEGFIRPSGVGVIDATISRQSIDRVVILIDAFLKALKERNIEVVERETGIAINNDGEQFQLRIYETRDRKPHEPTAKELKEQSERDAWRAKYPSIYSDRQTKVYRTWDWFPSGRLSFGLYALDWRENYRECRAGQWYDRTSSRIEDHLNAAIIALVSTAAHIKHKRAVAAEQARLEAEAAERRRRAEARKQRARDRRKYLTEKADAYTKFCAFSAFAKMVQLQVITNGEEPLDRLERDLSAMVSEYGRQFDRAEFNAEIARLKLFAEDDFADDLQSAASESPDRPDQLDL